MDKYFQIVRRPILAMEPPHPHIPVPSRIWPKGHKADHLAPSDVKVKKKWLCTLIKLYDFMGEIEIN